MIFFNLLQLPMLPKFWASQALLSDGTSSWDVPLLHSRGIHVFQRLTARRKLENSLKLKKVEKTGYFWPFLPRGGPNRSLHWIYWPQQMQHSVKLAYDVLKCVQQGLQHKKLLRYGSINLWHHSVQDRGNVVTLS